MKKLLLIASLMLSTLIYSNQSYYIGGSLGNLEAKSLTNGTRKIEANNPSIEAGFSWNKIVIRDFSYKLELGLGAKYQKSILSDSFANDSYVNTIPVYFNTRFSTRSEKINYFVEGQIGYVCIDEGTMIDDLENYFDESIKVKGGLYTGIEAGMEISDFYMALNYSISNFEREKTTNLEKESYKYMKPSLIFGIRF